MINEYAEKLNEEEVEEEVIRRENEDISSSSSGFSSVDSWSPSSNSNDESIRGWLYLIAGAGYGLLVVYLFLVIFMEMKLPILSNENVEDTNGALTTAILISALVYVTIWFFMSGKKHSFFVEDPDKAKFYAGIIGLASLVIIAYTNFLFPSRSVSHLHKPAIAIILPSE